MTLPWLRPAWEAPRGVRAAFTLRSGGVRLQFGSK